MYVSSTSIAILFPFRHPAIYGHLRASIAATPHPFCLYLSRSPSLPVPFPLSPSFSRFRLFPHFLMTKGKNGMLILNLNRIRILYMPPVYAIISFFSYRFFRSYTYYELIEVGELRDSASNSIPPPLHFARPLGLIVYCASGRCTPAACSPYTFA